MMIPVNVVDVTQQHVMSDAGEDLVRSQIILWDESGRHALVIWVGEFEALATALGIAHYATPRPITPEFMARILDATHATIEAVEISALQDNAFYATVRLKAGNSVQEIDARPSDALALAVRVDAPVFVAEDVMEKTGIPLPEDHTPNGKGVQAIIDRLNTEFEARAEARAEASTEETESTDWEARARAILADAFE